MLIVCAASLKSFQSKDGEPPTTIDDDPGKPPIDFGGEKRSNDTHPSTTHPDARLFRKGKGNEAKLYYMGHALMENRHPLPTRGETERDPCRGLTLRGRFSRKMESRARGSTLRAPLDCRPAHCWVPNGIAESIFGPNTDPVAVQTRLLPHPASGRSRVGS